jgi:hypothetical protein
MSFDKFCSLITHFADYKQLLDEVKHNIDNHQGEVCVISRIWKVRLPPDMLALLKAHVKDKYINQSQWRLEHYLPGSSIFSRAITKMTLGTG